MTEETRGGVSDTWTSGTFRFIWIMTDAVQTQPSLGPATRPLALLSTVTLDPICE
jgi:hypothetical protein